MSKKVIKTKHIELNPKVGLDESALGIVSCDDRVIVTTYDCYSDISNRYPADEKGLAKIKKHVKALKEVELYLEEIISGN